MTAATDQAPKRQDGAAVERLRAERDISQTELALKAGISQPTLSRIIKGKINAKLGTLTLVALALDVPVTELLSDAAADKAAA